MNGGVVVHRSKVMKLEAALFDEHSTTLMFSDNGCGPFLRVELPGIVMHPMRPGDRLVLTITRSAGTPDEGRA